MPGAARRVFVDTNVLLYSVNPGLPEHDGSVAALTNLWKTGADLCISNQVANEFLSVASGKLRKHAAAPAIDALAALLPHLTLLHQGDQVLGQLLEILRDTPVEGLRVYDANIIATMLANGVHELLTNNVRDFAHYEPRIMVVPLGRR